MKILFAVNNDNVSEAIVKKYQSQYKEILSYKNVYYFNAILRELQKDKSYSRIVISEDLEPFANNNYDSIDKFLFEKYSSISEHAKGINNERIDIIIICADRRRRTDNMIAKIYKNEIYNAILGQDRSIEEVCRLINSPREKEEARKYYNIRESELGEVESEDNVSEAEVENIRAHYARLGKNEDKYIESFNNIVSQYSDTQLKIIIKYLPMNVKAVLEERSPKYQQLVTTSVIDGIDAKRKTDKYKEKIRDKSEEKTDEVVEQFIKQRPIKSVVIPNNIETKNVQKVVIPQVKRPEIDIKTIGRERKPENLIDNIATTRSKEEIVQQLTAKDEEPDIDNEEIKEPVIKSEEVKVEEPKRGRGRPRKNPIVEENKEEKVKRGRGRPRKNPLPTLPAEGINVPTKENEVNLFELENEKANNQKEDINLFDMDIDSNITENNESSSIAKQEHDVQTDLNLFDIEEESEKVEINNEPDNANEIELQNEDSDESSYEISSDDVQDNPIEDEQEVDLFSLDNEDEENVDLFNITEENSTENDSENIKFEQHNEIEKNEEQNYYMKSTSNVRSTLSTLITADKKIVAFVGTTKNGTSFIVNNIAAMLASMGIKTAVLDLTKSKNSYYIYTNNEENLRNIARNCMDNLHRGNAEGIKVNKNLSIYTEMPGEEKEFELDSILGTLLNNYSAILIDTDFNTSPEVFERVQEIYLVQTMDVLTIQPLTAFLRNLKSKEILRPEDLRIVINKYERVRGLNVKTLIGGMANYNAPNMTYMTELFNKDNIAYCEIPFETQNYIKYLESMVMCSVTLNGYTKALLESLRKLSNMVYPLVGKQQYGPMGAGKRNREPFSSSTNETLNKMRSQY